MSWCRLAQSALRADRRQSHHPHQPFDSLVIHLVSLLAQPVGDPRRSIKRPSSVLLVDQSHQQKILLTDPLGIVVETRPAQPQQLALTDDGDL